MTNKQREEKELKFRQMIRRSLLLVFFISGLILLVAGFLLTFENEELSGLLGLIGIACFIIGIICMFLTSSKIRELKKRIKNYCPNCDTPSLLHTKTTKENTGELKNNSERLYARQVVNEINYYRCENCGHEQQSNSKYLGEGY